MKTILNNNYPGDTDSMASFTLSHHAQERAAQRGLGQEDIDYVLCNGHLYDTNGEKIYFLRSVDIPSDDQRYMQRLEGTAVIVNQNHPFIITLWRNRRNGSRNIRHKLAQTRYHRKVTDGAIVDRGEKYEHARPIEATD